MEGEPTYQPWLFNHLLAGMILQVNDCFAKAASHLSFSDVRQETVPRESKKKSPNQQIQGFRDGTALMVQKSGEMRKPPGIGAKTL